MNALVRSNGDKSLTAPAGALHYFLFRFLELPEWARLAWLKKLNGLAITAVKKALFALLVLKIMETEQQAETFLNQAGSSDGSVPNNSTHVAQIMETEQQAETFLNQAGSSDGSVPNNSTHVAQVKKLLFRRMLVGVSDGRFFLGTFYCIDKQGNIILQDAIEYRSTRRSSPSPMEQRGLGLILIPFSCRTSCHVDCSIDEQLSLLSLQEHN
ncbi:unnamed protein product [Ilex paraguariensis]|uniref:Sm domain-containing protein n=1 Tax=Ilex paraguariensis TaxID=185542 RepID=A0ABC8TF20_9AQUA